MQGQTWRLRGAALPGGREAQRAAARSGVVPGPRPESAAASPRPFCPLRLRAGWVGEGDTPLPPPRAVLLGRLDEGEAGRPSPARTSPEGPSTNIPDRRFLHLLGPAGLRITRNWPRSTQSILSGCSSTKPMGFYKVQALLLTGSVTCLTLLWRISLLV